MRRGARRPRHGGLRLEKFSQSRAQVRSGERLLNATIDSPSTLTTQGLTTLLSGESGVNARKAHAVLVPLAAIGPVSRFVLKSAAMCCFRACAMPGLRRVLKSRIW